MEGSDKKEGVNKVENKSISLDFCNYKHERIDNDIKEIRLELKKLEEDILKGVGRHREKCQIINDNRYENLKYKVICTVKSINNKIDSLSSQYGILKNRIDGNGNAGIYENMRSIQRNIKIIWVFLIIFTILGLGGSYSGLTLDDLREKIFGKENQKIEKIEESNGYQLPEINPYSDNPLENDITENR